MHEGFVGKSANEALAYLNHLFALAQTSNYIVPQRIPREVKYDLKNPFYMPKTKTTFRTLFGEPSEISFVTALLMGRDFLRFGHGICELLKNYRTAPDISSLDPFELDSGDFLENFLISRYGNKLPKLLNLDKQSWDWLSGIIREDCDCACAMCKLMEGKCFVKCRVGFPDDFFPRVAIGAHADTEQAARHIVEMIFVRNRGGEIKRDPITPLCLPHPVKPKAIKPANNSVQKNFKIPPELLPWALYEPETYVDELSGRFDSNFDSAFDKLVDELRKKRAIVSESLYVPKMTQALNAYVKHSFEHMSKIGPMLKWFDADLVTLADIKQEWTVSTPLGFNQCC
jgi:hypothetical protein